MITISLLAGLYPGTPQTTLTALVDPLQAKCDRYQINTPVRIAAFLAQTGHESAGFTALVENLNYSASGLQATFGRYFPTLAMANAYARQPQKIANRVYANRMGNGDEASGDGWTYRGKGLIEITGKANTQAFADAMEMSLADGVAYMLTTEGAVESAGWFWATHNLNRFSDIKDIEGQTRVINGGTNGLTDRQAKFQTALALLGH